MPEFDFNKIVLRRGTRSYKWDSREDVIPLWVADMDFQTAPCVIDALRRRVEHGVFGYTRVGDNYYDSIIDWFSSRHLYAIDRESIIYVPGVVPAISAIIKALVRAGEGVIVQTPVYNCFFSSIRNNGCRVVENPLVRHEVSPREFTYTMDYDNLEVLAAQPDNRMLLLCNPHNPVGRVWTREELMKVHEICRRHNVIVVSDEIHCELTMPKVRYVPYGTIDREAIVCVSPSKAFNIAGLQIANIIVPLKEQREAVDRAININEVCDVNSFGPVALEAAYTSEGGEWLRALRYYIADNYYFLRTYLGGRLPSCPIASLEGTYLVWVDISALGMSADALEEKLLDEGKVWVNSGLMYGKDGYIRINIACPHDTLEEGLRRICDVLMEE